MRDKTNVKEYQEEHRERDCMKDAQVFRYPPRMSGRDVDESFSSCWYRIAPTFHRHTSMACAADALMMAS